MRTIWKCRLHIVSMQHIDVPGTPKVLHLERQGEMVNLWLEVDTSKSKVVRTVYSVETGESLEDILSPVIGTTEHIGTIVFPSQIVRHFYMV